ncbi:universal stress protein [Streptomyces caeni]|uniref:Universal stress protein n=1 Tax=Streptomyces caeni TaxID=2307231 RepID=A0ABW4IWF3_9ACTN
MRDLTLVLIAVGAWIAIGFLTAWWMARRGHRHPSWLFMGAVFGPVLALVAPMRVLRHPRRLARTETGPRRPGGLRVLVGVDGSAESLAALDLATGLLGPYTESLVAAEVVGYDAAEDDWDGSTVAAKSRLNSAAERSGGRVASCEVLAGPPAQALARYAHEQRIDLIIVGRHGRGLSKRLLGNVAQELVREGTVPVLVAGGRQNPSDR